MRDNFERFDNNISIDVMKSQAYNAIFLLYSSCCVKRGWKIKIVCEGFVISETHDAYCFILNSIFKMCPRRKKMKYMQ